MKLAIVILLASVLYNAWQAAEYRELADKAMEQADLADEVTAFCEESLRRCVRDLHAGCAPRLDTRAP